MRYVRLYADEAGASHFEDIEVPLTSVDFAPPAPPVNLSAVMPTTGCIFACPAAGWYGDWHPAPRRQFLMYLAGEMAAETSGGEVRRFGAGSVLLVEDTTGKGHRSWVVGDGEVLVAIVQLPS
jgi:hypothetical protein